MPPLGAPGRAEAADADRSGRSAMFTRVVSQSARRASERPGSGLMTFGLGLVQLSARSLAPPNANVRPPASAQIMSTRLEILPRAPVAHRSSLTGAGRHLPAANRCGAWRLASPDSARTRRAFVCLYSARAFPSRATRATRRHPSLMSLAPIHHHRRARDDSPSEAEFAASRRWLSMQN